MSKIISIIDYGAGNLQSVSNALDYLGINNIITSDKAEIEKSGAVILPGVGAFPDAMDSLIASGLIDTIKEQTKIKPFLGICLGMQMLFTKGMEITERDGLNLIPGTVELIKTELKLPQIGWNSLNILKETPLTKGISSGEYVYFVHSFYAKCSNRENLYAATDYGTEVAAIVGDGYIYGCQFHPEKSGEVGLTILKNFGGMI